jgi:DNA repair exonuclease SbcCD ATPase subunit
MLTATEELLGSWPGTLIVVSHDRYLLERITDQQYAILDGRLRHLPGGVDEYLRLTADARRAPVSRPAAAAAGSGALAGAELRAAQKELTAVERRLARLAEQIDASPHELAAHDQADHLALAELTRKLRALEDEVAEQEGRWLELSESVE